MPAMSWARPTPSLPRFGSGNWPIVYLGLESGSDEVLRRVHKGITAAEMVEAVQKLQAGRNAGLGHRAAGAGRNGTLG